MLCDEMGSISCRRRRIPIWSFGSGVGVGVGVGVRFFCFLEHGFFLVGLVGGRRVVVSVGNDNSDQGARFVRSWKSVVGA